MELKLTQQLSIVDRYPLFLVFLDIRNSYNNLEWGRLLKTLESYGVGPKLWGLLAEFLSRQEVVTRQNVFRGPQLRATRGKTQWGNASPTIFNVSVYIVVRQWVSLTV